MKIDYYHQYDRVESMPEAKADRSESVDIDLSFYAKFLDDLPVKRALRCAVVACFLQLTVSQAVIAVPHDPLQQKTKQAEQIEEGVKAAQESKPVPVEHKPHVFNFGDLNLELTPPKGFMLEEIKKEDRKTYALIGPKRENGTSTVLTINLIAIPAGQTAPPLADIRDAILHPFRTLLAGYEEEDKESRQINGHTYDATYISGAFDKSHPMRGFFFMTKTKNAFCILSAQDSKECFEETQPVLLEAVDSCKILDQ